jgi:hypothetical protein
MRALATALASPLFLLILLILLGGGAAALRLRSTRLHGGTAAHPDDIVLPVSLVDEGDGQQQGTGTGGSGHYEPDLTLHSFLHSDAPHHAHKVEGIADALATGTSEILLALAEHHGVAERLQEVASEHHDDSDKTQGLVDSSLLEQHLVEHGLAHHGMEKVSSTVGAMTHRIFQKLHAGAGPAATSCPTAPDVAEDEGGATVVADALADETKKYDDPSAFSETETLDPAAENTWQDLDRLVKADITEELIVDHLEFLENEKTDKHQRLLKVFGEGASRAVVQEALDSITMGMDMELGSDERQDEIVEKLEAIADLFGTDPDNAQDADEEVLATSKADASTGAQAVEMLVDVLKFILEDARRLRVEISANNPAAEKLYTEELARAAKGEAEDDDDKAGTSPSAVALTRSNALPTASAPSLGQKIKDLFKHEWTQLKAQAGPIVALLSFLKMGVGWVLPITLGDLMNPKLPGIGINCQPIAPCVAHMKTAGAAIMRAVWTILTLPLKVLWIVIKTILNKVGGDIMKRLSSFSLMSSKKDPNAAPPPVTESGSAATASTPGGAKPGFSGAPISPETTNLVPMSESSGGSWSSCKLCNLRLQFGFALALSDCFIGFGLAAFKITLSTMPQSAPTLFKCAGACLKIALSAIKLTSAKSKIEKTYWQETCSPHSVGMCMLNARVAHCGSVWGAATGKENPLPEFIKAAKYQATTYTGTMTGTDATSGISSINMCGTIPESVTVTVARARNGALVCPGDASEAFSEWSKYKKSSVPGLTPPDMCNTKQFVAKETMCDNMGCSKQVFRKGQCATMSLRRGCNLVREKMISDEKKQVKTCGKNSGVEWGSPKQFTDASVPQVDVIYEKCMRLMKCVKPSDVGGAGGAGGLGDGIAGTASTAKKMNSNLVLKMIQNHMDSMDYLSEHPAGTLKSPKEASLALFRDLKKAMDADTIFTEQEAVEKGTCRHDWKLGVSAMWRSPLWSGRCVAWERPPENKAKYDIINGLLKFTIGESAAKTQKGDAETLSKQDDYFGAKVKELAAKEGSAGDPQRLCQPNANGEDPSACTFLSSLGAPALPLRSGQVVNRGLLLADAMGIARTNVMWCVCDCCTKKNGKPPTPSEREAGSVCHLEMAGHRPITNKDQCSPESCNLRFKDKCPNKVDVKAKKGMAKATVEDYSNAASTCEQVRDEPLTTGEQLENRILFWLKKHRNQRAMATACDKAIVTADMTKAIDHLVDANPGFQAGLEPLKVTILEGAQVEAADAAAKAALAAAGDAPSPIRPSSGSEAAAYGTTDDEPSFMEVDAKYEPSPAKGATAGWTEARCMKCCDPPGVKGFYTGESADPKQMRSCGRGGSIVHSMTGSSKATKEMCAACSTPEAESVPAQDTLGKMAAVLDEEMTSVEQTATGAGEKPVLVIRACSLKEKPMPNFGIGNALHIAFPTTIRSSVSMTAEFQITRRPYAMLDPKSQTLRYCVTAVTSTTRSQPWTPAESIMVSAGKSGVQKTFPFAFIPKQVASAMVDSPLVGPLPILTERTEGPVEIDCEGMKLLPGWKLAGDKTGSGALFANKDTVGFACNCDATAAPVVDASACTDTHCEWKASQNFCGVKNMKKKGATAVANLAVATAYGTPK